MKPPQMITTLFPLNQLINHSFINQINIGVANHLVARDLGIKVGVS